MQTSIEWLIKEISRDRVGKAIIITFANEFQQAKKMNKKEIMKAYSKQSPIEEGVFTSVNKAEQYYNQTFTNE